MDMLLQRLMMNSIHSELDIRYVRKLTSLSFG